MNEDVIRGAGRRLLGEGEQIVAKAIGSERLRADGIVDQTLGTIRQDYGEAKDVVSADLDQASSAVSRALDRGQRLAGRTVHAVRGAIGEHERVYAIAGAATVLAGAVLYAGRGRRVRGQAAHDLAAAVPDAAHGLAPA